MICMGSTDIAPLIRNSDIRRRWVINFAPRLFYSRGINPDNHWTGGYVGPRAHTEIRDPKCLALYLVTMLTKLSRFNDDNNNNNNNNNNNENKNYMLHGVLECLLTWSIYSSLLWKTYPSAILQSPDLNNSGGWVEALRYKAESLGFHWLRGNWDFSVT